VATWGRPGQFELTNRGLRIRLPFGHQGHAREPLSVAHDGYEYLAALNCRVEEDPGHAIALALQLNQENDEYDVSFTYVAKRPPQRTRLNAQFEIFKRLRLVEIGELSHSDSRTIEITRVSQTAVAPIQFWLPFRTKMPGKSLAEVYPRECWNDETTIMTDPLHEAPQKPGLWYQEFRCDPSSAEDKSSPYMADTGLGAGSVRGGLNFWVTPSLKAAIVFGFDYILRESGSTAEATRADAHLVPAIEISGWPHDSLQHLCAKMQCCMHKDRKCKALVSPTAPAKCQPYVVTCTNTSTKACRRYPSPVGCTAVEAEIQTINTLRSPAFVVNVHVYDAYELGSDTYHAELEAT
jgi:hypothetical protein